MQDCANKFTYYTYIHTVTSCDFNIGKYSPYTRMPEVETRPLNVLHCHISRRELTALGCCEQGVTCCEEQRQCSMCWDVGKRAGVRSMVQQQQQFPGGSEGPVLQQQGGVPACSSSSEMQSSGGSCLPCTVQTLCKLIKHRQGVRIRVKRAVRCVIKYDGPFYFLHLRLGLSNCMFHSGLSTEILYAFFSYSIISTRPTNFFLTSFTTQGGF